MSAPIHERASRALNRWPELQGHARWSEAKGKFFLAFSAQNLFRIFRTMGKIQVRAGQAAIDALKLSRSEFKAMCDEAMLYKGDSYPIHMDFKVKPLAIYQHKGVVLSTFVKRVPLLFDCGLGKTYISLVSAAEQIKRGLVSRGKILVAGKLLTLKNGWLADCEKFTDLKAELLWIEGDIGSKAPPPPTRFKKDGTPIKARERIPYKSKRDQFLERLNSDADIFIINHESIPIFAKELAEHKFERIIIDEATILKNFRGETSKAGTSFGKHLMSISEHAEYRTVLTGTPAPNSPADLWGLFHWLDPLGFLLEPTYWDFQVEYMEEKVFGRPDDPLAKRTWFVPQRRFAEIAALHSQLSYRARLRDHLTELPELTTIARRVTMGKAQAKHYHEMETTLGTEIEDEFISTQVMLAQMNKLRQITGGFIIDQTEIAHEIEDGAKVLATDQLIFDEIAYDEKIILVCQYQWEIQTLCKRYQEYNPVSLYGGNTGKKNLENVDRFLTDDSVRIVVLNPASAAHGITFTNCRYMIIYSMDFSAERDYQVVKRMERAGQKRAMFLYYLVAERPEAKTKQKLSVDMVMWNAVAKKHSDQAQLIDQKEFEADLLSEWRKNA
jgi:SNF2 family DNA or RNA helicase